MWCNHPDGDLEVRLDGVDPYVYCLRCNTNLGEP